MAESIRDKINYYRQKLDNKIKTLTAPLTPEPKAPPYPEDATPVMTHFGTPYMHVWLDNNVKPAQTCLRLRNGYLIRLDQRITQALAIAMLKLPYTTELPETPTAHEGKTSERDNQVRGQESAGQS
jgi:hypothetical protein